MDHKLDLPFTLRIFEDLFRNFESEGYFQEAFGYECVNSGMIRGKLGLDIEAQVVLKLRKTNLWPIIPNCRNYSEDDLFDVIEFLCDCVSKPVDGWFDDYNDCGYHATKFDSDAGRLEFRSRVNPLIRDYGSGFELSEDGEILALPDKGLETLMDSQFTSHDPENIDTRVAAATRKFRRRHSSASERKDAVRYLADVLEYMRASVQTVLTKEDEKALFHIANQFGIRHHNQNQRTDYDQEIWLNWMFYFYLSTIHVAVALLKKSEEQSSASQDLPF
ncbi:MAG: hypothetical protein WC647_18175 [Desulfomonilaceae bacterium]